MLRNKFIAVMVAISTICFVVLAATSSHAFAQNNCAARDNAACAQSDLSLPIQSENDIATPGLQREPEDQSRYADERSGDADDESEVGDISNDAGAFILPFP